MSEPRLCSVCGGECVMRLSKCAECGAPICVSCTQGEVSDTDFYCWGCIDMFTKASREETEDARRIDEIKERLSRATKGPWKSSREDMDSYSIDEDGEFTTVAYVYRGVEERIPVFGDQLRHDSRFIANAPEDITYLLDLVEKLQAVAEEAEDWSCSNCGMILGYGPDDDEDQPCECCKKLYERIVEARRAECE